MKKPVFSLIWCQLFVGSLFAHDLSPFSNSELKELEKEFVQQINQSPSVERNALAVGYINRIGKELASKSHIKSPDFFIVKSNEINAFAGPGGHIGINTELILATHNESELAGVMAHEMAHVRLHHLYNMLEHQRQMRIPMVASMLASIALGIINPTLGMGAMMGSLTGLSQDSVNFTRSKEKEADRIGINMLINAGFNPQSMATFFKKMQENARYYYTANIPAILRTHPLDSERIAEAENRTLHYKNNSFSSSLDYYLVKEFLRVNTINNRPLLLEYYKSQCFKKSPKEACIYGNALILIKSEQFESARLKLTPLVEFDNNLFYQIAMSQIEVGLKDFAHAKTRLQSLTQSNPKNYALIMAYAQTLIAANQYNSAVNILLKGSREFKKDLPLCYELARAQAKSGQKNYAYFSQAQCLLLEGQKRAAVAQLRVAQKLAKKDDYLLARINAKIEEITN